MSEKQILNKYIFGDMCVIFLKDNKSGCVGMTLLPLGMEEKINLEGWWNIEPAVQIKVLGDNFGDGFSHGHTMKNSATTNDLEFIGQNISESSIITEYKYKKDNLKIFHYLNFDSSKLCFTSSTCVENCGNQKIGIEMLSSFNICAFPCIGDGLRQQDLILHRMQSKWSMEGKLISEPFLNLQLEPAWLRIGSNSIRFGQVGSMPVRKYFPWMIVEDKKFGYSIGAQLAHPCSWQMEIYNRDEKNSISGGIADREFGHWMKYLEPNQSFTTPTAILTTAKNDIDEISYRLTSFQKKNLDKVPQIEKELPVIFNEYCTTWGNPTQQNMEKIAEKLQGHGITYCVIDAGWHVKDGNDWSDIGDWITNKSKFPEGLKATADKIKACGMIPGLWYEMEVCAKDSGIFNNTDMLLTCDNYPIQTGLRRFLDMRKPENIDYLTHRVINNLKENGFGYLKVDYNDNIGIGCDGAESLGEGLRQNMEASQGFFKKIHSEMPELVIENCSSGGHRLEPSMMSLASMASFSDAHEWQAIPVIAANVTRAILPAQSQIWAVLRAKDDDKRLHYSLANTFLGRMCLSGDIYDLSPEQWSNVDEAVALYKKCNHIIAAGKNYITGIYQNCYNNLEGWQAVTRVSDKETQILIVVNTFSKSCKTKISIDLPKQKLSNQSHNYKISQIFARKNIKINIKKGKITIKNFDDFEGIVILLEKN